MLIIRSLIFIFSFIVLHALSANFLSYPFNLINIFAFLFIFDTFFYKTPRIIIFLIIGFILDIFSNNIFGVNLISIFITCIIMQWLLKNYLFNYHFYIVFISGFLTVVFYRLIYLLMSVILNFLLSNQEIINTQFVVDFVWESLLTAIFTTLVYLFIFRFVKSINSDLALFKTKRNYGRKRTF